MLTSRGPVWYRAPVVTKNEHGGCGAPRTRRRTSLSSAILSSAPVEADFSNGVGYLSHRMVIPSITLLRVSRSSGATNLAGPMPSNFCQLVRLSAKDLGTRIDTTAPFPWLIARPQACCVLGSLGESTCGSIRTHAPIGSPVGLSPCRVPDRGHSGFRGDLGGGLRPGPQASGRKQMS